MEVAFALGGGLIATVALAVFWFLQSRSLIARADRADDERRIATTSLSRSQTDVASLKESIAQHEKNADALNRQISELATTNRSQAAKIVAMETSAHDLFVALQQNPAGVLPAALEHELDRLRTHVPQAAGADQATPAGDSSRGAQGAVHVEADIRRSR